MAIHGDRSIATSTGDVPIAARRRRRILQKSKDVTPTQQITEWKERPRLPKE